MSYEMPLDPLPIVPDILISDMHAFHPNIIKYSGRPEDHTYRMVKHWRETVTADDVVLNLGDITLPGGAERFAAEIMPQLVCKKHYLIMGNHDHGLRKMSAHEAKAWYESIGFTVIRPYSLLHNNQVVTFTHAPSNEYKYGEDVDRTVFAGEDNWWNVFGHIHTHLVHHPRMVNVCVEQTAYRPVRFDELMTQLLERDSEDVPIVKDLFGWTV